MFHALVLYLFIVVYTGAVGLYATVLVYEIQDIFLAAEIANKISEECTLEEVIIIYLDPATPKTQLDWPEMLFISFVCISIAGMTVLCVVSGVGL